MKESDAEAYLNPDLFFCSGFMNMRGYLEALESVGLNLRTVGAVLELGCGSARLIRHLRCIEGIRLVGTDVVRETVEW